MWRQVLLKAKFLDIRCIQLAIFSVDKEVDHKISTLCLDVKHWSVSVFERLLNHQSDNYQYLS